MNRPGCAATLVALLTTAAVVTAASEPFHRDQTASPARLSGVVATTDVPPQPVRRAIVSLTGGERALGHHTITDDEGRFEFTSVPPGRYSLSAARPSYVSIAYGASKPGRPGTAISLGPGQRLSEVRLMLARGAIITGIVRDSNGDPVPDLEVRVEPRGLPDAAGSVQTVLTDDRGRYRVFGLPAGTYVASARPRTSAGDLDAANDGDVDALLATLRLRRTAGAPPAPRTAPPEPKPATNFAPVYHPSVLTLDEAIGVSVEAGDEYIGVDITLRLMTMWSVSGVVVADDDLISLIRPMLTTISAYSAPVTRTATLAPDGTFRFPNVMPGQYMLAAQALSADARRAAIGAPGAPPPGPCAFASQQVAVAGAEVGGVSLVMRPCLKMAGRVVVGGSGTNAPDLSKLLVTLMQQGAPPSRAFQAVRRAPPTVTADGEFAFGEFGEILPGAYQISVQVPGSSERGYQVQSAVVDGRDILDTPLQITSDSPGSTTIVLTLSDQHTSLSGTLETPVGQPALAFTVIAFTANREWWSPPFRRVRTARPATDGHFEIRDLPAGEYYVAAMTDLAPGDVRDPELLSQAVATAIKVAVGAGEQKVQNLRIGGKSDR